MRSPQCWVPGERDRSTDPPASSPETAVSSDGRRVERITVHAKPPVLGPSDRRLDADPTARENALRAASRRK
jgi:hypothetical protein